jgi:phenylacetate-coenzyme A ligase PaaK-like adenylate-forming protein
MTTATGTGVDALRARYGEAFGARLPDHVGRLPWDGGRLAAHQRERLRALLACAIERSPFHARCLRGIDPGRFELDDLAGLPVMSKEQMMAGFDELMTDRRLSRARAEAHLMACADEPSLLAGRYVCLASGGSSGLRGLFVQTIEEYAEFTASVQRRLVARLAAAGPPPPGGIPVALVAAASPVHASGLAAAVRLGGYPVRATSAPATLPLADLVQRLNQLRPLVVMAHTSKLALLAGEQRAGRLAIAPVWVTAMGEQLTETNRAVISDAFGIPLINMFASTEGLVGHSDPGGTVLTFASDMCLAELVDEDNQPVPDGTPSAKVLLTNLYNHTQPLIRYELTDRFTGHPAGPGSGYLRATVEGRADDTFRYGAIAVDPLVIRSVMVRTPAALEYQARQTSGGIDVAVVASGQLDDAALAASLGQSLRAAGLPGPRVRVRQVPDIARHPETGKARRFIPL